MHYIIFRADAQRQNVGYSANHRIADIVLARPLLSALRREPMGELRRAGAAMASQNGAADERTERKERNVLRIGLIASVRKRRPDCERLGKVAQAYHISQSTFVIFTTKVDEHYA